MEVIGQEIIAGFQGDRGLYMENLKFTEQGKPVGKWGKPYPYGIRREKSPDGKPYERLAEVTKAYKVKTHSRFPNSVLQDRGGAEESSLINSLSYHVTYGGRGVEVTMDNNNDISNRLEKGGDVESTDWTNKDGNPIDIYLPPRPHRGVQDMVRRQIESLLTKWAQKDNGRRV